MKVYVSKKIIRNRTYWCFVSERDECNYCYEESGYTLYEAKQQYIKDHGYSSFEGFEFIAKYAW